MPITKIVSGGQTGADRGGLDPAIELGILHGGWCPKGRQAEDGCIPDQYNLDEISSLNYVVRTEQNVIDSDATIIFTYGKPTGGSKKTVEFAKKHHRPHLHVDIESEEDIDNNVTDIRTWLKSLKVAVLNIAGSGESEAQGIQE